MIYLRYTLVYHINKDEPQTQSHTNKGLLLSFDRCMQNIISILL